MNRKDYEMYMNYKSEKRNLFKQNMTNFENDKKKLNDKYKENIAKIEEIEYMLENKVILPKNNSRFILVSCIRANSMSNTYVI